MISNITVDMISSFKAKGDFCAQSFPCRHGDFEIILNDKRCSVKHIESVDVYCILQDLKNLGRLDEVVEDAQHMWNHFEIYKDIEKMDMGWKLRPSSSILTEIFGEVVAS